MKNTKKSTLFTPKAIAVMGLCTAMTIVLDKFVAFPIGNSIRVGLGALPVIFAAIYLSPIAGAVIASRTFSDACSSDIP